MREITIHQLRIARNQSRSLGLKAHAEAEQLAIAVLKHAARSRLDEVMR